MAASRSRSRERGGRESQPAFFFSSRRRHTRSYGDWSSDVCSSDLDLKQGDAVIIGDNTQIANAPASVAPPFGPVLFGGRGGGRSEERRVGKECRARSGSRA